MKIKLSRARINTAIAIFFGGFSLVLFQNCDQPAYNIQRGDSASSQSGGNDQPQDLASIVCDATAGQTTRNGGLVAELFYMTKNQQQNGQTVYNFFDPALAQKHSKQIYFSEINWRPQRFDQGFLTQTGELVKGDDGQTLFEWFALRYHSELLVTRDEDVGRYEFTTLSDDGVIFEAFVNGTWKTIISDDGLHSPKMACSTAVLELKKNEPVPIRFYYYQGPATFIANILHWKKIPDGQNAGGDPECGKTSNSYFYDFQTDQFLKPYNDFLNRGWEVVPAHVFHLRDNFINPCVK